MHASNINGPLLPALTVMAEAAVIARMKKRQEAAGAGGGGGDDMIASSDEESRRQQKYSQYQVTIGGLASSHDLVWPVLRQLS